MQKCIIQQVLEMCLIQLADVSACNAEINYYDMRMPLYLCIVSAVPGGWCCRA